MLKELKEGLKLVPGVGTAIGAGELLGKVGKEIWSHPFRTTTALGCVGLMGFAGVGAWQGKFETSVTIETTVEVEDPGRGEIIDIDLEIPEHPLVGYTAAVKGAKTVLTKTFEGKVLGKEIKIPTSTNWLTLNTEVPTVISYDPSKLSAQYDPGMISDPDDDRIIISAPLDAFSIANHTDPVRERFESRGDWRNLPANAMVAVTESFEKAKDAPGVGAVDAAKNEMEQSLLAITRVNVLNNVASICGQEVAKNETVAKAMRLNIAEQAALALQSSTDPEIRALTIDQVDTMEKVVYFGVESDAQPFLPGQVLEFKNPYEVEIAAIKKNPDINLESAGKFECEFGDEVKAMLAEIEATASPTALPSSPTSAREPVQAHRRQKNG